ncbi:MAG: 16S rRNA (cytidine(1402)-2'-O)-methyltransferase [Candidatus Cloacimonetes bacterium]|nr:16S rRNA (cytidine(1402)-2'-O)-methyltransferase [Candidatus Cloacimonadota bacterium]
MSKIKTKKSNLKNTKIISKEAINQGENLSTLYLVPTPIGNMLDMTFRAVQVLKEVDIIFSEDTRTSGILLNHFEIKTPQRSYHKFNEKERCGEIIRMLKEGKNIAIISDAGTPGISDPSNIIVKEAIKNNIKVCPLPGATALIPALIASSFETERFFMVGFLPIKKKERDQILNTLKTLKNPIIFYESPHRLYKTLIKIKNIFFEADICIAREISKIYETFYRGKLSEIINNFDKIVLKGEFVIVLMPSEVNINPQNNSIEEKIFDIYRTKYSEEKLSIASKMIAEELNIPKKQVYDILSRK